MQGIHATEETFGSVLIVEKIQYYLPDLSALLGIGEITDIYVHEESGSKILRITCKEKGSEYKTFKSPKATKKTMAQKKTKSTVIKLNRDIPEHDIKATKEPDFLHKAVDAGKSWLSKPMKRPDEW